MQRNYAALFCSVCDLALCLPGLLDFCEAYHGEGLLAALCAMLKDAAAATSPAPSGTLALMQLQLARVVKSLIKVAAPLPPVGQLRRCCAGMRLLFGAGSAFHGACGLAQAMGDGDCAHPPEENYMAMLEAIEGMAVDWRRVPLEAQPGAVALLQGCTPDLIDTTVDVAASTCGPCHPAQRGRHRPGL